MNKVITEGHIEKVLNRLISKAKKGKPNTAKNVLGQLQGIKELLRISDHCSLSKAELACDEVQKQIDETK